MAGEWAFECISEVANVTDYVANGSFEALRNNVKYRSTPDYAVLVRLVDHNAGWCGDFVYVDKASYDFLRKSALAPGDIVIANVGANAGTVFRVPDLGRSMTLGPNAVLIRPKDENTLRRDFLYYYLVSNVGQESLRSILSGSAQPKFNKTDLRRLSVPVPPLPEQRAIAHILGTLDDKIELNRRQNETLEAMARALFKAWFVDFEPVRAKMEGRWQRGQSLPGLPAHLYDLFPGRLVESELGEIPEGWEVAKVDAVLERLPAKVRYTKEQVSRYGKAPVFEQGASILLGFHDGDASFQATPDSPAFVFGDHTCITKLSCQPFDISQNVIPLRGKNRPTVWVYHAVRDKQKFEEYRRHWMELINKSIVVAPQSICLEFSRLVTFFHLQLEECERESLSISQLRDTLLPKLISGELRISDVERIVEKAY